MEKSASHYLVTTYILFLAWGNLGQIAQAREATRGLHITLYVYNKAGLDESVLNQAESVMQHLFGEVGVDAVPLDVPLSSEEERSQGPKGLGPSDFFLHILTREAAEPLGLRRNALGLAPGEAEEPNRNVAYIFADIAERMALERELLRPSAVVPLSAEIAQILGHGMAHEIGHLLLGSHSHASTGIMRARWSSTDLCDIICGFLLFAPEEAARIRAEVRRRIEERQPRKLLH